MRLNETADARKDTIKKDAAWNLLSSFDMIYAGRGRKIIEFKPGKDEKEAILKVCLGRTGNLRSPAVKAGNTMFVGYNDNIYENLQDI